MVRPQDRVWVAGMDGTVERTVLLTEPIMRSHAQIPLINPTNIVADEGTAPVLRVAVVSEDKQVIVLWNSSVFHLVSLATSQVIASYSSLRSILDLSVTEQGEIFVLESGRSLVRLSEAEDKYRAGVDWRLDITASQGPDTSLESSVDTLSSHLSSRPPSLHRLANLPTR